MGVPMSAARTIQISRTRHRWQPGMFAPPILAVDVPRTETGVCRPSHVHGETFLQEWAKACPMTHTGNSTLPAVDMTSRLATGTKHAHDHTPERRQST